MLMCKIMEIMSPQVVQLLKCLLVDSGNIPAESHRHVKSSVPKEQTEQALASHPSVYSLPQGKGGSYSSPSGMLRSRHFSQTLVCSQRELGKFFYLFRRGSLFAWCWITVLSCKSGFTTAGLHFKIQIKIIPFSHLEDNFQVSL